VTMAIWWEIIEMTRDKLEPPKKDDALEKKDYENDDEEKKLDDDESGNEEDEEYELFEKTNFKNFQQFAKKYLFARFRIYDYLSPGTCLDCQSYKRERQEIFDDLQNSIMLRLVLMDEEETYSFEREKVRIDDNILHLNKKSGKIPDDKDIDKLPKPDKSLTLDDLWKWAITCDCCKCFKPKCCAIQGGKKKTKKRRRRKKKTRKRRRKKKRTKKKRRRRKKKTRGKR